MSSKPVMSNTAIKQDKLHEPVDETLFLKCVRIYQQAAMSAPTGAAAKGRKLQAGAGVSLPDTPANRGMVALQQALADHGLSQQERLPIAMRVMSMEELMHHQSALGRWIRPATDGSGRLVFAEALLRACAVAATNPAKHGGFLDIADVARHATRIDDAGAKIFH